MEGVYNLLGSRRGLGGAREDRERWRQEGGAPGRDQEQRQEGLKGLMDLVGRADEVGWAGWTGSPSLSALNATLRSLDLIKDKDSEKRCFPGTKRNGLEGEETSSPHKKHMF